MGEKKKVKKSHIVVFQDESGNVLKTSFVSHGEAAVPPQVPEKKGESDHYENIFDGWDGNFACVTNNLAVRAVYKEVPKKYLVMYFHENGKVLGMESVAYGSPAKAEIHPEKKSTEEYDYIFKGWSCSLDKIETDTNARAVFEKKRKSFPISFFHEDGTLLKEERVFYGESAHPPENVEKAADLVYHYRFDGWTYDTSHIVEPLNVHAVFEYIYNEYAISFFDGEKLIEIRKYHYGDEVVYPDLMKKGYDIQWNPCPKQAEQSEKLHASWIFSNPKGRIIQQEENIFKIMNPSIKNGAVLCIKYGDPYSSAVILPERVKLGDYFYFVKEVGPYAFSECKNMRNLVLPDTVTKIHGHGLADCKKLQRITVGRGLQRIDEYAFAHNPHLKEIQIKSKKIKKLHRNTFGQADSFFTVWIESGIEETLRRKYPEIFLSGKMCMKKGFY